MSNGWSRLSPPKDGTAIVAIGKIMERDELSTVAQPFTQEIVWLKDNSGYEGWHLSNGMVLAENLDDEVIIHYWIAMPEFEQLQYPAKIEPAKEAA